MSETNAALALQVMSGYHEVQLKIGELVTAKYMTLGAFGQWAVRRSKRLTDEERRAAFLAIAADAGLKKQVKRVPMVLGDAKAIRDRLAHSMTLQLSENGVRGFKDGTIFRFTAEELELTAWRLFWVLERVMRVAEVVDLGDATPFNILRRSGVRLIDAPPPAEPPTGAIADPSRVPRFELRYTQMMEREARRADEAKHEES